MKNVSWCHRFLRLPGSLRRVSGLGLLVLAVAGGLCTRAAGSVGQKAWSIVRRIHSYWPEMPRDISTCGMTPGALLGNGGLGVAIGGTAGDQVYDIGRDGFWSLLRGRIMPMGQVRLALPSLSHGSARLNEVIGKAFVGGQFAQGKSRLSMRCWTQVHQNIFAIELKNTGTSPILGAASLVDGLGHRGQNPNAGTSGAVQWLKVSPDSVDASIGCRSSWPHLSRFGGQIRSLSIFNAYLPHRASTSQPVYHWKVLDGSLVGQKGFRCGSVIMPQKHFTVSAVINIHDADADNAIFCAVAQRWQRQQPQKADPYGNAPGPHLPRAQGSLAGFVLYLSNGKLAANLNGTIVVAANPVPLHQWQRVAACYNGQQLTLLINGKPVAESRHFPTVAEVMGPKWNWAATHPGDAKIPYDGCGPKGLLALRVVGVASTFHDGQTRFAIPPGQKVTVLISAMDDRDSPRYFHRSLSELQAASKHAVRAAWQRHVAWWRHFWSKSYIQIPDKTVQAWWYGSLYVLASCSEKGHTAPGLWGNWITCGAMGWQGDYTLDYNYEASFWAAYPTNHISLADPYDPPLLAWIKRGRALAHHLHQRGLIYLCHLAPTPVWSFDDYRCNDQKVDALFAAVDCVQRWRYTRSMAYARKVWPFLAGVADFWDHDLTLVGGRYMDFGDAADEHTQGVCKDVNPATTIGFLNLLYPALIHLSERMHIDARDRRKWRRVLKHLSGLPIVPARSIGPIRAVFGSRIPAGTMVIRATLKGDSWIGMGRRFAPNAPIVPTDSSAGMNAAQIIFPGWNIGLESPLPLRNAALNTIRYMKIWYDANDTSSFYPAAADAGYNPAAILKHLHLLITHIGYPNFAYNIGNGGVENEATVPTTICAMLLQSYQRDIHLFADWPETENASFGNLLACGDFLVSSAVRRGKVTFVRIRSLRGGELRLANPWPALRAIYTTSTGQHGILRGRVLSIATKPGEIIRLHS